MAYVQVPKDLTKVKSKVMLNLTKRQLICFSLAGAVGVPFYLLTKGILGSTVSASIMIVLILPFFLFAMYEKDGRPLERVLFDIYKQKFKRPGIRTFQTNNIYGKIQDQIYERKVLGIGAEETQKTGGKEKSAAGKERRYQGKKRQGSRDGKHPVRRTEKTAR